VRLITVSAILGKYGEKMTASEVQWSEFQAAERKCIVSYEVRTEFIY
jgi:hypothetical protein